VAWVSATGRAPLPGCDEAKALQLAARLRARGATASAAAKLVGITAITLEGAVAMLQELG
jgi:hypothetical protein